MRDVAGPEYEKIVIDAAATKLKGKAAAYFVPILEQFTTVEALLTELTKQYGRYATVDMLREQLRTVKQAPAESVDEYGVRVQHIFNKLLTIYKIAPGLDEDERRVGRRTTERDALNQFMIGLRTPLDYLVRFENPTTLREALLIAEKAESATSARIPNKYAQQGQEKTEANILRAEVSESCDYCRASSHRAETCPKRKFDREWCEYCRRKGHDTRDCIALRDDIREGRIRAQRDDRGPDRYAAQNRYNNSNNREYNRNIGQRPNYNGQNRNNWNRNYNSRPSQNNNNYKTRDNRDYRQTRYRNNEPHRQRAPDFRREQNNTYQKETRMERDFNQNNGGKHEYLNSQIARPRPQSSSRIHAQN